MEGFPRAETAVNPPPPQHQGHTGSGAYSVYLVGTGGSFLGVKWLKREAVLTCINDLLALLFVTDIQKTCAYRPSRDVEHRDCILRAKGRNR